MTSSFIIPSKGFLLLRLLIAVAVTVVPLSMSHASSSPEMMSMIDHSGPGHVKDHLYNTDKETSHIGVDHNYHDHGQQDCCSGICGGALTVELDANTHLPMAMRKATLPDQAIEPGEWVRPFKPPSI